MKAYNGSKKTALKKLGAALSIQESSLEALSWKLVCVSQKINDLKSDLKTAVVYRSEDFGISLQECFVQRFRLHP